MNNFKVFVGIFAVLAASRFIPHPPNFTSLIALSFYIPALLGLKFLPMLLLCFAITDLIIGFHATILFTWGSVIFIGLCSKFFLSNTYTRITGALLSAVIFYLVTNFGVWLMGSYGYNVEGLLLCYTLAIPFFTNNLVSTLIFSGIIEGIIKLNFIKIKT
tara:strand:+ start:75 stop:554 length:480 start_codon:yes stop_codon:yes gene_type:complete